MAFENTHLFIAQSVLSQVKNQDIKKIITENIDFYNLGSIFPDIFCFRQNPELFNISTSMHNGTSTNKIIFKALSLTADDANLAFLFGYLTHCATDINTHPAIVYFSGYKKIMSDKEKEREGYLHAIFETEIDKRINNKHYVDQIIKTSIVKDLIMDKVLNISKKEIRKSIRIHKFYFKLFPSSFMYPIFRIMHSLGLIKKKTLGLFYKNLEHDQTRLPSKITYQDLFEGYQKTTTIEEIIENSIDMSLEDIDAAYRYSCGKMTESELRKIIQPHDLDTGAIGKTKVDIVFFKNEEQEEFAHF
jgi:hypothetical protein